MKRVLFAFSLQILACGALMAQNTLNNPGSNHANKFEQLGTILPTPNEYRTASGAPGTKYWQQRVDYDIKCELDEVNYKLTGTETITYFNNSPDVLTYLWLQLDENQHSTVNNANYQNASSMPAQTTDKVLDRFEERKGDNGYGFNITKLVDATGKSLKYLVNKTISSIITYIEAAICTNINNVFITWIFFNYIDGFEWKIRSNLFPVLTIIITYIQVRCKIVKSITIQGNINPRLMML